MTDHWTLEDWTNLKALVLNSPIVVSQAQTAWEIVEKIDREIGCFNMPDLPAPISEGEPCPPP